MSNQNRKSIHIEADPKLHTLLPKYLENRKRDLVDLRQALKNKDFDFVRRTSHTIKGHAGSYGFIQLTEICKKIEKAALGKEFKTINELLDQYDEYVSCVELN